ncbi:MAG: efflux RND transporter permease subunit [Acholeplasma sp.]|jgi:multidrug efflux pump subunit AcrB|nr:MAG: efflux RND transporter permease subunit [Acholeplasma sp.]
MKKITQVAIAKYKITIFVSLIIMGLGIYSFILIPKQDMPDLVPPVSSVQIVAPGYSLNDVQKYITNPIEDVILSVDGVDYVDSLTLDNLAIFNIILNIDEIDTKQIFDEIFTEINGVSLPDGVMDPIMNNIIISPHAVFGVSSDAYTLEELTAYAEEFQVSLSEIDKVSSVNIIGASDLQVYVNVDYQTLNNYDLTMNDLVTIINYNGLEIPIGTIANVDGTTGIQIPANFTSITQLNNLIIGVDGVTPIRLSDVATVTMMENPTNINYIQNNKTSVFVEVFFETDIDFTVLGNVLIDAQEDFGDEYPNISVERMTFQPDAVNESLNQVYSSLIIGVLLVIIVIFVGLGLRNAISVAFTFPLIILSTIGLMYLLNQDLQKVTIAALIITIGIIVDNSIVISESIQYYIEKGVNRAQAALLSVQENSIPILTSSLTTIAAFIPFMVISGVIGKMIRTLPLTVSIAIGISYLVALFIMPVFGALFFTKTKKKILTKKKESQKEHTFYTKTLPSIIKKPWLVIGSTFVILILSIGFMLMRSELELFPVEDDNIIYIDYAYNDITDAVGANQYALEIINTLSDYEEIYYTAYSVGGDLPGFNARTQINDVPGEGRIFFRLDVPYNQIEIYVEDFISELKENPNITENGSFLVKQLTMNFGGDADIQLAISANDYQTLLSNIDQVTAKLSLMDDIDTFKVQEQATQESIVVNLNRNLLIANKLTPIEVQQQISNNINGGSYYLFEYNDSLIQLNILSSIPTIDAFEQMNIRSSITGNFVPLNSIATFETETGVQMVKKHNGDHQVLVDIYLSEDANVITATSDVVNAANSVVSDDVRISLGGQAELRNDTFSTLGIAAIFAILVVYFIMFVQFNSFKSPIIILLTVPLSFIGSALLVGLTKTPISFTMIFGITSLIGIVVNMGILLIDYINKARMDGETVLDACVSSVQRRLRPILLSSITTIVGLIPLAIFGGAFFTPMAVSLMGGLIASTALTIFVVPTAYYLLERNSDSNKQKVDA